uniref:Uncharacterized protein n=1 Tax=Anguilla anguilla TaxID=7936 RepID=A0A0E9VG61_ANGAN
MSVWLGIVTHRNPAKDPGVKWRVLTQTRYCQTTTITCTAVSLRTFAC